ncbi:MAG: hypothetical protein AAGA75_11915 [Cyanobacteria bacterium P01_E01_bin.6]
MGISTPVPPNGATRRLLSSNHAATSKAEVWMAIAFTANRISSPFPCRHSNR